MTTHARTTLHDILIGPMRCGLLAYGEALGRTWVWAPIGLAMALVHLGATWAWGEVLAGKLGLVGMVTDAAGINALFTLTFFFVILLWSVYALSQWPWLRAQAEGMGRWLRDTCGVATWLFGSVALVAGSSEGWTGAGARWAVIMFELLILLATVNVLIAIVERLVVGEDRRLIGAFLFLTTLSAGGWEVLRRLSG